MRMPSPAELPPAPSYHAAPVVPPGPEPGATLPDVHVPRALVPGESGRGGAGAPPESGRRPKRRATVWVGASSAGAELVVLVDQRRAVVGVWPGMGLDRLGAVEEALLLAGDLEEVALRLVVDVSTSSARMLVMELREQLPIVVEEALPDRAVFAELRAVLDQGAMVYHLLELVKVARLSEENARRAASSMSPALEEMQRPTGRETSIPNAPRWPWVRVARAARRAGPRAALAAVFTLVFLGVGVWAGYEATRPRPPFGARLKP